MRCVFIGTNPLTLATAAVLLDEGHEVVLIEKDKARIEELSEKLDCGFLHGDGTSPELLEEADPANSHVLFSLMDNEQLNIIAALVGRSLKYPRVVPLVSGRQFERICTELGLTDSVAPNRAVARHLAELIRGEKSLELSSIIRDDAEVFSFIVGEEDACKQDQFQLPASSRIICLYRDDKFVLPEETSQLQAGDEVILITRSKQLETLRARWGERNGSTE